MRTGPMRIICVAGARPNYMKIKPVIDALARRDADVILVHSGQHYDPAMNDVFFNDLGIRPPGHPDVSCHDSIRAAGRTTAP
jgi:UDP-N-acetylglucosamine 2-epimerase